MSYEWNWGKNVVKAFHKEYARVLQYWPDLWYVPPTLHQLTFKLCQPSRYWPNYKRFVWEVYDCLADRYGAQKYWPERLTHLDVNYILQRSISVLEAGIDSFYRCGTLKKQVLVVDDSLSPTWEEPPRSGATVGHGPHDLPGQLLLFE